MNVCVGGVDNGIKENYMSVLRKECKYSSA